MIVTAGLDTVNTSITDKHTQTNKRRTHRPIGHSSLQSVSNNSNFELKTVKIVRVKQRALLIFWGMTRNADSKWKELILKIV